MITKYVGSPADLNKVKRIALIYSPDTLLESQIYLFYPHYFGNKLKHIVDISSELVDGEYVDEFILTDFEPFEFNSIIFYDPGMNPIGFSILDQPINTSVYGIETIIIIPDFIIDLTDNRYIEITLGDTNYSSHVANTDKVHKKLFNTEDYALTPDEVLNHKDNPTKFTNQLKEALQLNRVYRYAGNFSMTNNILLQREYSIDYDYVPHIDELGTYVLPNNEEIQIKINWNRIFKINNHYYFITYNNSILVIKGLDTSVNFEFEFPNIVQFGSNIFVTYTDSDGYTTYSTLKLIDGEIYLLSRINDELRTAIRFTREFDDDSIHPYKMVNLIGPEMITNKMKDLFSRLKVTPYLRNMTEIIGFSKNLLIYKSPNTDNNRYSTYILTDVSIETPSGILNSVPFKYEFEWDQLESISNKAILLHRTSSDTWKLLQISPKVISKLTYELTIYELGTTNNWRKLDFIARTQVNPTDLSILMNPIDGNLWKYSIESNNLTFSIL